MVKDFIKKNSKFDYRFIAKLLLIIAFWEAVLMVSFSFFDSLTPMLFGIIDTFLLTFFSGVSIWYFLIHPLRDETQEVGQELDVIHQIGMVSATDLYGNIIYANDSFCKVSGYTKEEVMNKNHNILNSGKHPREFFAQMWTTLKAGQLWHGEVCNKKKNGDFYWVDAYIFPITDTSGQTCKYVSFRFEITAEKLVEEALNQQKVKNIHMDRLSAIGEMSAGVAHEINNPLAIISGLLSVVEKKIQSPDLDKEMPRILDSINKTQFQISRMSKIISGLREFSRSGESDLFENVSSQKITDMVGFLFNEKLKSYGVRFEIFNDDVEIHCNHVQIEQVLVNLISNSVDAVAHLNERWIKLYFLKKDGFVEISVTDSGHGISDDISKKIMEPFFTTKDIGKGTGLGLSISRGIVEKHGGVLFIDNESPNTRFVVQIPLHEGALLGLINIDEAVKSHLAWRHKLLNQMSCANSDLDSEFVSSSHNCIVGKWIQRAEHRFITNPDFLELKNSHSEFHKCAGEIVRMTQRGEYGMSELALGSGSDFDKLSNRVVASLRSFRYTIDSIKKTG